jgi:methionyl-tRNA formyltransferase
MNQEELRIVFLGTPEFAMGSLEALVNAGFAVAAVVTSPDTPSGRGLRLKQSPVKEFALSKGIPVLQPVNLKDPAFLEELKSYGANLQVVVAFRMLPESVWAMPELGTFNLHASLLPQYRGAAPINRAVINGETVTGVTTFFLQQEIDTGQVLFVERVPIGPEETSGELHDRLMALGAGLVVKTAVAIREGGIRPIPQEELIPVSGPLKPAPKIYRNDCRIDWSKQVREIFNHIRGLSPYPGAFSHLVTDDGEEVQVKIFRARPGDDIHDYLIPGRIRTDGKHFLKVACGDGWIDILQVQQAGKRRMETREFLIGFQKETFQSFR